MPTSSVLTIGGSTIARTAARVVLDRLTHSLDRPDELEFTEQAVDMPGSYGPESAVTLDIDGTREFTGWIFSRSLAGYTQGVPSVGYRCLGLRYGAYLMPVTASDGTDTMMFNLPVTDDFYVSTQAGRSVGQILTTVFAQHASQLTAIGISTDATTTTQLGALTVVPPESVYFSGNSLWSQVDQLLQQWYGSRYASYITPGGLIRVYDTTSLATVTATLDSEPWVLGGISEDTGECYTQVVLRGRAEIEPAYLSTAEGNLLEGFTSTDKTNWKLDDFEHPKNASSSGAITAQTSTTVTIQSDSATEAWGVNYWSGIQAQISLFNPIGTLLTDQDWRKVTANTALTAGGTSVLTLDRPLAGSGFTRYQLRGQPSGISNTWRKYTIKNTYIAQHLVEQFNHSVPWSPSQSVVAQTTSPRGEVSFVQTATGGAPMALQVPADLEIIPYDGVTNGYVRFLFPLVKFTGNSDADLAAGTGHYTVPTNVQVVVPYSRGALTVQSPSGGGYAGTAYTRFGVQRTLYRSYPMWMDKGDATSMQTLADEIAKTVHDATIEGSITYLGKYSAGLIGGSWPFALSIAKATGTTSYESLAAPVRTVTLAWPQSMSEGAEWLTSLQFSTRRQMYSGDRLYVHPNYTGGGILGGYSGAQFAAGGLVAGAELGTGAEMPGGVGTLGTEGFAGAMPKDFKGSREQQAENVEQERQRDERAARGVGGQAGFGTEVMGTMAPDFDINQAYASAGAFAGPGPTHRGGRQAQGLRGVTTTEEEREQAAALNEYRTPHLEHYQGMRGVTTTAEEREQAAALNEYRRGAEPSRRRRRPTPRRRPRLRGREADEVDEMEGD